MQLKFEPLISIVDDDESVRLALRDLLAAAGWRVACFPLAEAFLADPASEDSACVVSDLQMPGMDGFALHRALLARGSTARVVLISGFATEAVRARAARQGVFRVIEKPFEPAALLDAAGPATGE